MTREEYEKELKYVVNGDQEPCEDAISRAEAEALFRNARSKLNPSDYKTADEFNTRDLMLLNAEQFIHLLPSVTPKQKMGFAGMTNGEVIQTLFPNGKVIKCDEAIGYEQMLDDKYSYCSWFDGLWWDAKYKAESEDKE